MFVHTAMLHTGANECHRADDHAHHAKTLQGHPEIPCDLGDKGHHAASSFAEMENRNAQAPQHV